MKKTMLSPFELQRHSVIAGWLKSATRDISTLARGASHARFDQCYRFPL